MMVLQYYSYLYTNLFMINSTTKMKKNKTMKYKNIRGWGMGDGGGGGVDKINEKEITYSLLPCFSVIHGNH